MRPLLMAALVSLPLVKGCGQAEPDRYKTKYTERPSKSVSGTVDPKSPGQEKAAEPAKAK